MSYSLHDDGLRFVLKEHTCIYKLTTKTTRKIKLSGTKIEYDTDCKFLVPKRVKLSLDESDRLTLDSFEIIKHNGSYFAVNNETKIGLKLNKQKTMAVEGKGTIYIYDNNRINIRKNDKIYKILMDVLGSGTNKLDFSHKVRVFKRTEPGKHLDSRLYGKGHRGGKTPTPETDESTVESADETPESTDSPKAKSPKSSKASTKSSSESESDSDSDSDDDFFDTDIVVGVTETIDITQVISGSNIESELGRQVLKEDMRELLDSNRVRNLDIYNTTLQDMLNQHENWKSELVFPDWIVPIVSDEPTKQYANPGSLDEMINDIDMLRTQLVSSKISNRDNIFQKLTEAYQPVEHGRAFRLDQPADRVNDSSFYKTMYRMDIGETNEDGQKRVLAPGSTRSIYANVYKLALNLSPTAVAHLERPKSHTAFLKVVDRSNGIVSAKMEAEHTPDNMYIKGYVKLPVNKPTDSSRFRKENPVSITESVPYTAEYMKDLGVYLFSGEDTNQQRLLRELAVSQEGLAKLYKGYKPTSYLNLENIFEHYGVKRHELLQSTVNQFDFRADKTEYRFDRKNLNYDMLGLEWMFKITDKDIIKKLDKLKSKNKGGFTYQKKSGANISELKGKLSQFQYKKAAKDVFKQLKKADKKKYLKIRTGHDFFIQTTSFKKAIKEYPDFVYLYTRHDSDETKIAWLNHTADNGELFYYKLQDETKGDTDYESLKKRSHQMSDELKASDESSEGKTLDLNYYTDCSSMVVSDGTLYVYNPAVRKYFDVATHIQRQRQERMRLITDNLTQYDERTVKLAENITNGKVKLSAGYHNRRMRHGIFDVKKGSGKSTKFVEYINKLNRNDPLDRTRYVDLVNKYAVVRNNLYYFCIDDEYIYHCCSHEFNSLTDESYDIADYIDSNGNCKYCGNMLDAKTDDIKFTQSKLDIHRDEIEGFNVEEQMYDQTDEFLRFVYVVAPLFAQYESVNIEDIRPLIEDIESDINDISQLRQPRHFYRILLNNFKNGTNLSRATLTFMVDEVKQLHKNHGIRAKEYTPEQSNIIFHIMALRALLQKLPSLMSHVIVYCELKKDVIESHDQIKAIRYVREHLHRWYNKLNSEKISEITVKNGNTKRTTDFNFVLDLALRLMDGRYRDLEDYLRKQIIGDTETPGIYTKLKEKYSDLYKEKQQQQGIKYKDYDGFKLAAGQLMGIKVNGYDAKYDKAVFNFYKDREHTLISVHDTLAHRTEFYQTMTEQIRDMPAMYDLDDGGFIHTVSEYDNYSEQYLSNEIRKNMDKGVDCYVPPSVITFGQIVTGDRSLVLAAPGEKCAIYEKYTAHKEGQAEKYKQLHAEYTQKDAINPTDESILATTKAPNNLNKSDRVYSLKQVNLLPETTQKFVVRDTTTYVPDIPEISEQLSSIVISLLTPGNTAGVETVMADNGITIDTSTNGKRITELNDFITRDMSLLKNIKQHSEPDAFTEDSKFELNEYNLIFKSMDQDIKAIVGLVMPECLSSDDEVEETKDQFLSDDSEENIDTTIPFNVRLTNPFLSKNSLDITSVARAKNLNHLLAVFNSIISDVLEKQDNLELTILYKLYQNNPRARLVKMLMRFLFGTEELKSTLTVNESIEKHRDVFLKFNNHMSGLLELNSEQLTQVIQNYIDSLVGGDDADKSLRQSFSEKLKSINSQLSNLYKKAFYYNIILHMHKIETNGLDKIYEGDRILTDINALNKSRSDSFTNSEIATFISMVSLVKIYYDENHELSNTLNKIYYDTLAENEFAKMSAAAKDRKGTYLEMQYGLNAVDVVEERETDDKVDEGALNPDEDAAPPAEAGDLDVNDVDAGTDGNVEDGESHDD